GVKPPNCLAGCRPPGSEDHWPDSAGSTSEVSSDFRTVSRSLPVLALYSVWARFHAAASWLAGEKSFRPSFALCASQVQAMHWYRPAAVEVLPTSGPDVIGSATRG